MTAASNRAAETRPTRREVLGGHPQPEDFRHRAACRSVDPEVFFPTAVAGPELARQVGVAKAVCAGCLVLPECLTWALSALPDGIAGGMTEHERRVEKTARQGRPRRRSAVVRPAGGTRAEVAEAGRAAIAAGMTAREAAGEFLVSRRTAERWARGCTAPASSASEGEGASAATVAPSRFSHDIGLAGHSSSGRDPRVDDGPAG